MLTLKGVTYAHPNRDILFKDIDLTIKRQNKVAVIGNNGAGKSTLLKIIAGELSASGGSLRIDARPYFVPQIFGQYNDYHVARALHIDDKVRALRSIIDGYVTAENLARLDDDWAIEERCKEAFAYWQLDGVQLDQKIGSLSGGQKTKVFLAGINIHQPELILLDEPSNHLDVSSRNILYDYIRSTHNTILAVSHDRTLLNLLDTVLELGASGITVYGGNYDFYKEQKDAEKESRDQELKNKEKELRKAKQVEREAIERQQRLDARGKKKQEKAGLPTISMNTFRNNAEKSTARMKGVHDEKVGTISQQLDQLRKSLPEGDKIEMDFEDSRLHHGKILISAKGINFGYDDRDLWPKPVGLEIRSGDRIVVKGANGSGKTTLVKIILGELEPRSGTITRADGKFIYIDQEYSLIGDQLNVYEQAQQFNSGSLEEHQIKIRLSHFLFTKDFWDKPCKSLSGGEKMRLVLCCLTLSDLPPDMIVLDEPTNNLDIQNVGILTDSINEYKGTLLVISHDEYFLGQINMRSILQLING